MSQISDRPSSALRESRVTVAAVAALLIVHAMLGLQTAARNSVTNDEFWHLPTGLWNLTTGKFHYENLNPPLLRMLAATPLVIAGAEQGDAGNDTSKEDRADAFVEANRERYPQLLLLSRSVPILLSVLTGWALACWAWELFGKGAAVLAAALWSLSPNVIAHAPLVTTDVTAAGAMLMIVRSSWQFARHPSWQRAVWMGLWLGIGQLVKYTCVLGLPLAVVTWFVIRIRNESVSQVRLGRGISFWLCTAGVSLFVLNAGYLFRGTGRAFGDYRFQSQSLQSLSEKFSFAKSIPVPFPADYIEGIDHQKKIMEGSHPVYLDGEMRFEGGFRNYYLMAWWYKTPHATQIACLLALLVWWWPGRQGRQHRVQLMLLIPVTLLFYLSSRSSMQLGLRYLLPVYPFLFLFASQTASAGSRTFGLPQLAALCVGLGLAASLRYHPHHLTYFNEYAGGPSQGHLHLLDSNLDWGQGLYELKEFLRDQEIEQINLAYFGSINPDDLDISFAVPPQSNPPTMLWPKLEPGVYAISANFLMGRPGDVRSPDGTSQGIAPHHFGYFRFFTPDAYVANCIFLYQLDADEIARMPKD